MYEPTPWPQEDGSFDFKEFIMDYYETVFAVSREILRLVSIGICNRFVIRNLIAEYR